MVALTTMGTPSIPLAERIARHTQVGPPNECWTWAASKDGNGYPRLGIKFPGKSTGNVLVARVIIHLRDGVPIRNLPGEYLCARHTCDRKWCVNPAHIIPGTMKDNMDDMWQRGLARPHHRFTVEQVRDMRLRYSAGETQQSIADLFGTYQGTIGSIVRRESWAWLE